MANRTTLVAATLCLTGMIVPLGAMNLGEPVAAARTRATIYGEKYGAVQPIFQADSKGIVVMECWAAPPEMWTKDVALKFGAELLPKAVQSERGKALPKDGLEEPFMFSDGTRLILQEFQGRYISVEVRAPGYKGIGC